MSDISPPGRSIVPETHPKHYKTHKYWARKPYNVVRKYIEDLSSVDDIVLDPFTGSGVTVIEALKAERRGIGIDINPISKLIIEATLEEVEHSHLLEAFEDIKSRVQPEVNSLFRTVNPSTDEEETVTHVVWESQAPCPECDNLVPLESSEKVGRKTRCPNCGEVTYLTSSDVVDELMRKVWYRDSTSGVLQKKDPSDIDRQLVEECRTDDLGSRVEEKFMHENSRTLVHDGYTVGSYFTDRNAYCLSLIISEIGDIEDESVKKVLKLGFTGGVAQASRLIPYRDGLKSGGPAWTVPGFWIPKLHFEINAWDCFENRFEKVVKGRRDLHKEMENEITFASEYQNIQEESNVLIKNDTSTNITEHVPDESVEYIFTDPPYGDNVPYLEYSKLWFSWLNEEADFKNEVVISDSSERAKDIKDYSRLLEDVFNECHRVLKKDKWMSLTFNNLDLEVWDALVSSVLSAGFEFKSCVYQVPAVISSKAQLARAGSPIGDVILNFRKENISKRKDSPQGRSVEKIVLEEAERIIGERNGQARTEEIVRGVVVALLNERKYGLSGYDISEILSQRFIEEDSMWRFADNKQELVSEYPDLTNEIEKIVRDALLGGADGEKEVMAKVFSELRGKRTPSTARIAQAYEKISKELDESKQPDLFS